FNKWEQEAKTVAAGNERGEELNQLKYPHGIFVDKNKSIHMADAGNNRIIKWKYNATEGEIIAGGNGQGNRTNQLNFPTSMIVDSEKNSLIIFNISNERVIQWRNQNGQEILFENIWCQGLAMDKYEYIYVSNCRNNDVRRWKFGEKGEGTLIAAWKW
ncbi:unnamed protein product, partial [Adineta ricciae]